MTNPPGTRIVFSIKFAGQLIKMGHELLETVPNPRKPELDMFLFKADPTFDEDFSNLVKGGTRDGK